MNSQSIEDLNFSENDNDEILNSPITDTEILKCIKSLKKKKKKSQTLCYPCMNEPPH